MDKILLTRSLEENAVAAKELTLLGCASYSAPMLNYTDLAYDFTKLPQHIIITSKYAAKIVASNVVNHLESIEDKDLCNNMIEAWVVGAESASILQKNSKIKVTGVAKDIKGLLNIISMISEDEAQDFFLNSIYLSGNIITHDLPYNIKRDIIYEVSYAKTIPEDAISAIKNGEVGYITAFSKNCASNLIKLLKEHNLLPYIRNSAVIGISEEIALLFKGLCSRILHSKEPTFLSMIDIIDANTKKNNTK